MIAPEIIQFGDHGVLLTWEKIIDSNLSDAVHAADSYIKHKYARFIIETVSSYQALAIYLQKHAELTEFISALQAESFPLFKEKKKRKTVTIPVCYSDHYGVDINELARLNSLNTEEIVNLHTQVDYRVEFIGFLPGFPYLSGLDPKLFTPRKPAPMVHIERGSVAIGGEQTGIYTQESPGGWMIIGRSPLVFFKVEEDPPSLLASGDFVRFKPIGSEEYAAISNKVNNNTYELEVEVDDD